MLKTTEMTRKEIVAFLKLNTIISKKSFSLDYLDGHNNIIEHLIDEFGDSDLAYNTDTGYFDYIGPNLPN